MGVARAFRESREVEAGLPVAIVAYVGGLCVMVDAPPLAIGTEMQRPGDFLLDYALLAVLAAAVVAWTVVRVRRGLDGATGHGFVLAAFGLWCRKWVWFLLYRIFAPGFVYGGASEFEYYPDAALRFLIAFHRIGGLVAFGLGVAWVVHACAVQPRSGYGR